MCPAHSWVFLRIIDAAQFDSAIAVSFALEPLLVRHLVMRAMLKDRYCRPLSGQRPSFPPPDLVLASRILILEVPRRFECDCKHYMVPFSSGLVGEVCLGVYPHFLPPSPIHSNGTLSLPARSRGGPIVIDICLA